MVNILPNIPSWKADAPGGGSAVRQTIQTNSDPVIFMARARVIIFIVSVLFIRMIKFSCCRKSTVNK